MWYRKLLSKVKEGIRILSPAPHSIAPRLLLAEPAKELRLQLVRKRDRGPLAVDGLLLGGCDVRVACASAARVVIGVLGARPDSRFGDHVLVRPGGGFLASVADVGGSCFRKTRVKKLLAVPFRRA